jgi:hypothetical protein
MRTHFFNDSQNQSTNQTISALFKTILDKKSEWRQEGWKMEICPITHERIGELEIDQVVLLNDGYLYKKDDLIRWLQHHPHSPMTRQPIAEPNRTAIGEIERNALSALVFVAAQMYFLSINSQLTHYHHISDQIREYRPDVQQAEQNTLENLLNSQDIVWKRMILRLVALCVLACGLVFLRMQPAVTPNMIEQQLEHASLPLKQIITYLEQAELDPAQSPKND